jgi:uncharacterized protein DUF3306
MKDDEGFISRWSRKKTEAKVAPKEPPAPAPASAPLAEPSNVAPAGTAPAAESKPLPSIESLTHESDFTPFMQAGVDPDVKREALKKLMTDPRHNIMDGLDVYIDDYSKPDPLPEGWLEKMAAVKRLGIFREPTEAEAEAPPAGNTPLRKAMEEQALAPPAETPPADTSNAPIPPSEVGKSS